MPGQDWMPCRFTASGCRTPSSSTALRQTSDTSLQLDAEGIAEQVLERLLPRCGLSSEPRASESRGNDLGVAAYVNPAA